MSHEEVIQASQSQEQSETFCRKKICSEKQYTTTQSDEQQIHVPTPVLIHGYQEAKTNKNDAEQQNWEGTNQRAINKNAYIKFIYIKVWIY